MAINKVRRTRNPDDYAAYKEERAVCTKIIKTAKTEHWKEYCTQITKTTTSRELWTKINLMSKRRKSGAPSVLVSGNGDVISNEEEKSNLFADVYVKVSSDSNLSSS